VEPRGARSTSGSRAAGLYPFEPSGSRSHNAARANWSTVRRDSRTPCARARFVCPPDTPALDDEQTSSVTPPGLSQLPQRTSAGLCAQASTRVPRRRPCRRRRCTTPRHCRPPSTAIRCRIGSASGRSRCGRSQWVELCRWSAPVRARAGPTGRSEHDPQPTPPPRANRPRLRFWPTKYRCSAKRALRAAIACHATRHSHRRAGPSSARFLSLLTALSPGFQLALAQDEQRERPARREYRNDADASRR
jgi:hypothetical protein